MTQTATLETQAPKAGYAMDDVRANVDPKPQLESDSYRAAGKLEGKAALVTGGDSGIGAAAAIAFAKEGADVAIAYYSSDDDAQAVAERIRALGRRALVFKGDVGDEGFCRDLVSGIVDEWNRLDVLVNNAGEQTPCKSILDLSQEQLVRTFQTNIFSMFYLVKAALPHLPRGGAIVNTTSVTAYQGSPDLLDYSSTKGAITAFTRSLSENEELAGRGIRVNAVAPGPIWTPLNPASYGPDSDKVRHFGESVPMGRPGQPYELAPAYVFLACDDSSYISGQVIHVNGGTVVNG
ncbi:SDR family oxidoreductase [Gordonibacter massiliensis (ex Traore et al. 2017)]|uniref:3beta-hydroxycholanate 3-dehydrogenase (NAD(+)) n=1 Tax=Gordonibacter massiliensis (ex Traore et al. 2017) TaxID=1841863 RepID=A0A842JC40_9ACTN|nr:SDR family oxidoreductase [Gordonibacter massiliensis (ex Traore et al. 2017)]MBC2889443.1 SDR family oxidoreductase [Gordonibacter massiliensis (ex Traore et al. 2017)]